MQTFLYVLGPFILQAGIGLAAVIIAIGFVWKVLVPKARLMSQEHDAIDTAYDYAQQANVLVCDLVVELGNNQLLEDQFPARLHARVMDLNRPVLRKELA